MSEFWRRNPSAAAALVIAAIVLVRVVVICISPLQLGPDEAQYWRWSRTLDFGYYSKPPLIAWLIAGATLPFGDSEWAVRLSAPILHGIAAWLLFMLGRRAFSAEAGAWAAALYLLMPGVWLSSTIMSTDAVLLPMWAASLLTMWRMRETPSLSAGALAGLALGLAMLAKYAALYLFVGMIIAAIIDKPTRKALLSTSGLAMIVVALAVLSPNLIWNAAHKFATVSHTTDNADWDEAVFDVTHLGSFLTDQMGVFGPLTFVALLAGCVFILPKEERETRAKELWLGCFIAPPLAVIAVQAVISQAHANWAATAYPAAAVLVGSWIARPRWGAFIKAGVALNLVVGLVFLVGWAVPDIGDRYGAANAYKRVRGWKETVAQLAPIAARENATALMFDEREVWHGVDYYGRNTVIPPVRAWQRGDTPRSHAEEAGAMRPGEDARVLVVSLKPDFRAMIRVDFDSVRELGYLTVPLGPKKSRTYKLFLGTGYHPVKRTPEFEAKYGPLSED